MEKVFILMLILCSSGYVFAAAPAKSNYYKVFNPDPREETSFKVGDKDWAGISNTVPSCRWVCSVPSDKKLFIAVGMEESRDESDYGVRMYLVVKDKGGSFSVLYKTKGAMDSYILHPTLFYSTERIFIMAETGAEELWGYSFYELKHNGINYLGSLDISSPGKDDEYGDVNPYTKIRKLKKGFGLEIYANIIYRTYKDGVHMVDYLKRIAGKEPICYIFDGEKLFLDEESCVSVDSYEIWLQD